MWSVLLAACSSSTPQAPVSRTVDPTADVIHWALGPSSRAPRRRSSAAYLLLLPPGEPVASGRQVTPCSVPAESFLPAPAGDDRLFFLANDRVYVQRARTAHPVALQGADPAMPVKRMLAFAAAASPLQLLVTVRIEGAAHEALWLLTVADSAIIAAQPASSLGAFANRESFFDAFRTPRCLSAGQRCLVLDEDPDSSRRYLDVEIQRDGPRQHIQDLADLDVRDATWASSTGSAMYLLVGCGP